MNINTKQDVIKWLKRLKDEHPLSVGVCKTVTYVNRRMDGSASVYTDQVIKDRYQGMIDYLESDEVTSDSPAPADQEECNSGCCD